MLRLYLDGVEVVHGTIGALSAGSTVPLDIGRGGTTGKYWQGKLDDVRIWNLVRSATQIAGAYQAEFTSAQTGLVGNWKMDDGTGSVATDSATVTRTYAYNGDGLLQSETGSSTSTLLWDPASSPAKLLVLNAERIVYAGAPLYIAHPDGTATTLALDGLGSVRAEIADNGPLRKSFRYAAYGAMVNASSGLPSLLGYTGELSDASGLVYLRARWYDPALDRFVSKDPKGGDARVPASVNGFSYANSDPIRNIDPSGRACAGFLAAGTAAAGTWIRGAAITGGYGYGYCTDDITGRTQSGAFTYSGKFSQPGDGQHTFGAYAGVGVGYWWSGNAQRFEQLAGPFETYSVDSPWFSFSRSIGAGIVVYSATRGLGEGFAYTEIVTNTEILWEQDLSGSPHITAKGF